MNRAMKISRHSYYLVNSEYHHYWIVPDFGSGRRHRFTTVVVTASGTITIGRELTLGHSKRVVEEDIKTKSKRRFDRSMWRLTKQLQEQEKLLRRRARKS
jgi:hypothetical protein